MGEETDPEDTLHEWKSEMQAEHQEAIQNPDPDEPHRIEGVAQITYRVYFEYDEESGELEPARKEQVGDIPDPELRSCSCGVRGMTPEEARMHVEAARS